MSTLKEISKKLKAANKVAVFTHLNPDGDALGSAFAIKSVLEHIGKDAQVYLEEPVPHKFLFLQGEYQTGGSGTVTGADTALAVDCGAAGRLGTLADAYLSAPVKLCVDHHLSNEPFGDIYFTDPEAGATAELIYELALLLSDEIPMEAMRGIYTGLSTDTGHFKYSNATVHTFSVAADLLRRGLNHREITRPLYDTVKLGKLRFNGAAANNIRLHANGLVASLRCPDSMLAEYGLQHDDIEELPNMPLSLEHVLVGILVKDNTGRGGLKVSLRGKDTVDLSKVASQFGGGGHKNAAAFVTQDGPEEILEKLIPILDQALKNAGVVVQVADVISTYIYRDSEYTGESNV